MSAKCFLRDQHGAVMVEVTIMLSITLILVLGAIDFLLLFERAAVRLMLAKSAPLHLRLRHR